MKLYRIALLAAVLSAGAHAECGAGHLVVLVNPNNAVESISIAQLRKLMLGDVSNWPDHKPVTLVHRTASSAVFKCMLSEIMHMTDAEYKRYQLNAQFRGDQEVVPKVSDSGTGAANMVAILPGAITLIEADVVKSLTRPLKIVRIDGKQPGDPGYPF